MIKHQKKFNKFKKELREYWSDLIIGNYEIRLTQQLIIRQFEIFMNEMVNEMVKNNISR